MSVNLKGKAAIITGASEGLGFAISKAYVEAGAKVMMCARDATRLHHAANQLVESGASSSQVVRLQADVSSEPDVRAIMETALREFSEVHILVNNAGVYGPMGPTESVNWDAWVSAVAINLFGSVLMCRAVVPHFKKRGSGKIIQLSGGGATSPLPNISAYAASKAAVVRFAETLAEELREHHIDVNAVAPGALNTRMLDEVLASGAARVGEAFFARALRQKTEGGAPLTAAADLAVFLGSDKSNGITGKLLSAVWDPWQKLSAELTGLSDTDVYTLRRITPADRKLPWGDE